MKKILFFIPFMAISLMTNCGGNSSPLKIDFLVRNEKDYEGITISINPFDQTVIGAFFDLPWCYLRCSVKENLFEYPYDIPKDKTLSDVVKMPGLTIQYGDKTSYVSLSPTNNNPSIWDGFFGSFYKFEYRLKKDGTLSSGDNYVFKVQTPEEEFGFNYTSQDEAKQFKPKIIKLGYRYFDIYEGKEVPKEIDMTKKNCEYRNCDIKLSTEKGPTEEIITPKYSFSIDEDSKRTKFYNEIFNLHDEVVPTITKDLLINKLKHTFDACLIPYSSIDVIM